MKKGENMSIFVASDLHGSYFYGKKMVHAIRQEEPERLLLLGDILYHGPRNPLPEGYDPMALATLLNGLFLPILAVRGNCDSEVDQQSRFSIFPFWLIIACYMVGNELFS